MKLMTLFFESHEWVPGYHSLADLNELDTTEITLTCQQNLEKLVKATFAPHNIYLNIAVYAPHDLVFGLSRMCSVEVQEFENHQAFRDKDNPIE